MRTLTVLQVLLTITIFSMGSLHAQELNRSELFGLLKEKDSLLFSIGFNECNLDQIEKLVNDDFEFFHDKDGITGSKKSFLNTIKNNLCNSGENILHRDLDVSSLEVFPLHNEDGLYGALQNGVHYFGSSTAKFSHLWLLDDEEWKLSRVFSYAHGTRELIGANLQFIKLSDSKMMHLLGEYQFSPDFILSIILEEGKLYGDAQGEKIEIRPTSDTEFATEDASTTIKFNFNENGDVTGLLMTTAEGGMNASKIDKG